MPRRLPAHRTALCTVLLLAGGTAAAGQEAPTADAADVSSMDAVVGALYDVISGPAGEERDWERFRGLFAEDARLIVAGTRADGETVQRSMTPEQYIERSGPTLVERGFFEREIGQVTERFGPIAHRFSAYAARQRPDDTEPFMRGVNSIQLLHDGERWWIVTVYWTSETPELELPERYVGDGG